MEEEKNGISLADIFRTIFSQKWLALILAVAITLLCAVCIVYIYNPIKTNYSVSFKLDLPGGNSTAETYRYPDGTTFHYLSLVSPAMLKEIKADGGEQFAGIDVDGMVKKGDISISEEIVTASEIVDRTYTVSVKASYFINKDVARDFIARIAEYPCKYLAGINIEYNSAIKLYEASEDYARQIEYLKTQLSFLEQKYGSLINEYGNEFVVENGKTLKTYLSEVKAYGESAEFVNMKAELKEGKYVKNEACLKSYKLELAQVEEDLTDAQSVLDAMTKGQPDAQASTEAIKAQAEKVAALNRKKLDLEVYTADGAAKVDTEGVFAARLKTVADKLGGFTDCLKNVTDKVYQNASSVFYVNSNVVNATGGMGTTTTVILSIVAGVIIAAIAAYIVGYSKNNKALAVAAAAGNAAETPADEVTEQSAAAPENEEKAEETSVGQEPENK
ncbi:MAG: hypothetical protein K2I20_03300 [Clostridia bacterium]|nr:hypothetical protein [Clostridia bacterium]MDE7214309.1 hypothetical protein [Clostridia bacterium]